MKKLLHMTGRSTHDTSMKTAHPKDRASRASLWLMMLALLCVGKSSVKAQTYCTPSYYSASYACSSYGMAINNLSVVGSNGTSLTDNGSGCDGTGYQDRTTLGSGLLLANGGSFVATVTNVGSGYPLNYQIWVDYNDNGTFETTESVGGTNSMTSGGTISISIPVGSTPGVHRMRVRAVYSDQSYPYIDPCSAVNYGEAQDYLVNIGCLAVPAATAICVGSSTSLTASGGTSYSWAPATGLSSTTGATVTANPSTTTTYTITATTATCGTSTATTVVSVNPLPTVNAGSNVTIVTGSSTTLSATGTAGSYSWSPATGLSSTAGATVVANPTVTTTYTVTGSTVVSDIFSYPFLYGTVYDASSAEGVAFSTYRASLATSGYIGLKVSSSQGATEYVLNDATVAQGLADALRNGTAYRVSAGGHVWEVGTCAFGLYVDVASAGGCNCTASWAIRPYYGGSVWGGVGSTCNAPSQTLTIEFIKSGTSCTNTSTVTVTVAPPLSVSASASTICSGSSSTLTASGSTGYTWAPATGLSATTGAVVTATPATTTTYTVTAGSYTAAVTVSVNPSPAAIGGTAVLCMGATTTLSNSVSDGSWTSSNTVVATIDASGVVTPVSDGITTVSYTLSTGCYKSVDVTVNPLPQSITGTTDMCAGNTTALSSATTGGAWTSASSSTAAVNSSTGLITSGSNAGITNITYTLPTGCAVTTTVNNMVASIYGSGGICSGLNVTLSDATSGGAWSSSDASVAPINISGVITAGAGGAATITYTTTSGCYRTKDFTVVTTPPAITGTLVVCVGSSTPLSTIATGGTWSAPASSVTTGPSTDGVIYGLNAGTNTVTYSLSSTCRTSVIVTVNPIPQVITGTDKVCVGNTTALATVSTGGAWSSSDPTLATVDPSTGVVTGVTSGTPVISYAFTSTGCARTAPVTVNPTVPTITGPATVCVGSSIVLANSSTSGTSWTSSDATVATVTSTGVVTGVGAGAATITFTVGTGCIATSNITVSSVTAITGASSVCAGSTTTLSDPTTGGVWSSSNPAKATIDPSTGVVTGVAEGATTISYGTGSCSATKSIAVSPQPTAITGYPTACVGTATTLTSVGNSGTWVSSTPAVATIGTANGIVAGVTAGTSTMTYTVTSTGCTRTAIVTVVATPGAIGGTATACAGTSATMTNSVAGGAWSSGNNAIATVDASTGVVTGVGAGTATISYSFGTGCRAMASFTTKAQPAVIGGAASVCMPVTSSLSESTTGGTWSSGNTSVATVGSAGSVLNGVVSGVSTGTANITYTITSTGCFRTTQVTVNAGLDPGTISPLGTVRLRVVSAPHTMTFTTSGVAGGTWTSSNPSIATVDPSSGLVTGVAAGSATISYTVVGACSNTSIKAMTVAAGRDGDNNATDAAGINLYPNPTNGTFTIETEQAGDLHVFTIDGREVSSYQVKKGATEVTLPSGLATGIYMCRYTSADGTNTMIRLVFEH